MMADPAPDDDAAGDVRGPGHRDGHRGDGHRDDARHDTPVRDAGGSPSPRRRPARSSRTQLKLFEAAMVIMSEKGPTATTVDEVAAKAGVSKGTVYYNFGSKKSMVEGLLSYGIELVLEHIADAGAQVPDPRERLLRGTIAALRFLADNPGFARLAVAEIWRPGHEEGGSGALLRQRAVVIERITAMVDELGEYYAVAPHPDNRSVAVGIFGATFMLAMDREVRQSERTTQQAARTVMTLVDGYILGPKAEGRGLAPDPGGAPV
ncbi:TetR/AcrR family transcriptional regulator [Rothia sp. AR01]|uniref:TetR/AcrR family transcriptional regulator n=1 Tax=Rothia santali TaxID=2949643 RepID=A0A9X2KHW4_9MICC|nr:TetR/AcrR family transcriptional regulator [Rothia santali]MCP3425350.1 TetR/AcrR family transcriptional regulator [Rothia santali]